MGECKFRKGDRVQLLDGEPVFEPFRGAIGTVADTTYSPDGSIAVFYDHFGRLRSDPATLLLVGDDVDVTELNSFLENQ